MSVIRSHSTSFRDGDLLLRPLTDADLPLLARWNADPEVLHFSEGDVEPYTEEDVASVYGTVSRTADCFLIEAEEMPIGECWIRPMRSPFPEPLRNSTDCRRIDIMIGEPSFWGKGYGSRAIGLLCCYALENTSCTHLFACGILDYNERCRKAFEKNGFRLYKELPALSDDQPGQLTLFKGKLNKIF